jgi:hypothetical protein
MNDGEVGEEGARPKHVAKSRRDQRAALCRPGS